MLSQNDKIFFGEEIFEDCEIFIKKFVGLDGQQCFVAVISSDVSKLPERYQDLLIGRSLAHYGDTNGYLYIFDVTFVSSVFILWCIVSYSNFYYHLFNY